MTIDAYTDMVESFTASVKRKTRRWGFKMYPNCFVGAEAVNFLVEAGYAKSREQAVILGQRMMDDGLFAHVKNEHPFKDKKLFYEFTQVSIPEVAVCR
mmetsp:Transcript_12240/g.24968  ORF Transcript_12240/g.24968 Transcript_12240/m.24968 type:complete len:98 (+) Transcript_12240:350-643(+)